MVSQTYNTANRCQFIPHRANVSNFTRAELINMVYLMPSISKHEHLKQGIVQFKQFISPPRELECDKISLKVIHYPFLLISFASLLVSVFFLQFFSQFCFSFIITYPHLFSSASLVLYFHLHNYIFIQNFFSLLGNMNLIYTFIVH